MASPFDFASRANPFAPAPSPLESARFDERALLEQLRAQEEEQRRLQDQQTRRQVEEQELQATQQRLATLRGGGSPQMPTPGVPSGMAPPRPQAPQPIQAPPSAISRDVELDRLYEDYKQKVEHPDLGFAWGGGQTQAYKPGDDIRSGQYGAAPTEGAGIRAGTTENRIGGTASQMGGGTFSQSNMEDIPIGQRPHSWFQDQQMQTELERMYADRARSKAMTDDPLGLKRYDYQFNAKGQRDQQLDALKRRTLEDLQASIQAAMSDPSLPPERKEAEIARMRNEAYAELEAIDPRADFSKYMGI